MSDDTKFSGVPLLPDLTEWMRDFTLRRMGRFPPIPLSVLRSRPDDISYPSACTIGQDVKDSNYIDIGIGERRSGLYILGRPRMGKSWLMVNMILQDIENRHGIFFLDPHGDAIDDLINHITSEVILLDPENEDYTFGINVLECPNIDNMSARNDTFTKAKGVFDKLWKNTFNDKPWLQMILQNTLYAFIETQGLTLAELPIFYRNPDFRRYVVSNIRYNWQVHDYWDRTFASKSKHDQDEIMEAAQTRAAIMLAHPYVSDIVGQAKTTIDFGTILSEKKVVLVKLSNRMSEETKKIVGTILVSELLHAIEHRPVQERDKQFCIFIDEFQNFASYRDFPVLITQAPKYGVATTLAHHERYGQLAGNPEIMGATSAIANKVLFQITARDAHELAPEFSEEPETETRQEETYIISQNPVYDMLKWHPHEAIREFVKLFIRPLKERLEDIRGESEAERLIRTEYLDEASMYRIDERMEGLGRSRPNLDRQSGSLSSAGRLTASAGGQTRRLMSLNEEVAHIRRTFRALNKLFTGLMEGKITTGSNEFISLIQAGIAGIGDLTDVERQAINVLIEVIYGRRAINYIPYDVAKAYDLVPGRVKEAEEEANDVRRKKVDGAGYNNFPWFKEGNPVYDALDVMPKPNDICGNLQGDMRRALQTILEKNNMPIQKVQLFVRICELISQPENHIRVKSGQYAAKQVNIRTEADMTNEMARNLTNLPKYTAYAKILQDEGSRIWIGKIRTLELGATTVGALTTSTLYHVEMRWKIQEEIAERHKRLMGNVTGDNEPPPFVY